MTEVFYATVVDGKIKFDNPNLWDRYYKRLSGQSIEISVKPLGKKRNVKQNRYYWKVIVKRVSDYLGYSDREVHEILKNRFDVDSTKNLNVYEFSEYIEDICRWAAVEWQLHLPNPSSYQTSRRDKEQE
tara:strand:+ start:222 stop:608 length:387 start_codon:yes stop_codon:yes gene_type:complete